MGLLDYIKKWHIFLHLIKDLNYLIHVCILLVVLQPIWKWYYRLIHLTGWLVFFRLVRFWRIGARWSGCLYVIMLNGIGVGPKAHHSSFDDD